MCFEIIYLIYIDKKDLALNNSQWLVCHKTKPNQSKPIIVKSNTEYTSDIILKMM